MLRNKIIPDEPRKKSIQKQYDLYKKEYNVYESIMRNFEFRDWILKKNMFPYDLEKNIQHYVLWIHPNITLSEELVEKILTIEGMKMGYEEMVYFENEKRHQSVPTIPHIQVFYR